MTAVKPRIKKSGEISSLGKLFEVKKNQIKMMSRRGYILDEEDTKILEMNQQNFLDHIREKTNDMTIADPVHSMNKLYTKKEDDGTYQKNYVYYISPGKEDKKICTSQILSLSNFTMEMTDVRKIDVISDRDLHNQAREKLKTLVVKTYNFWLYKELSYDIFESSYVPVYKILKPNEIKEIFFDDEENPLVRKANLPHMRLDDPVCKYLLLDVGDIVEYVDYIRSVSSLVPRSLKYRQVTKESIHNTTKNDTNN